MILLIEIIVSLALILIGAYTGQLILVAMGFAILLFLAWPRRQPKPSKKEETVPTKYKHRVLNSEAPASMTLTPAEMSAPFFPMMQADLDKQKEKAKKEKEEGKRNDELKVDLDAFPIFRGNPINPFESFFSMMPFDMFKRAKLKRKDKEGKDVETSLFDERK